MKIYAPLILGCILAITISFLGQPVLGFGLLVAGVLVFFQRSHIQDLGREHERDLVDLDQQALTAQRAKVISDLSDRLLENQKKTANLKQRIEFFENRDEKTLNPFGR